MEWTIHNAEVVAWCKQYKRDWLDDDPDGPRFHAILSDPPYGIAFMGKRWDDPGGPDAFQAQVKEWGEALAPLLYPGALVMMYGGTRMWHRLAAGMEDAGFYLWDTCMWLYGSGFPKALSIAGMIDKKLKLDRGEVIGVKQAGIMGDDGHHSMARYRARGGTWDTEGVKAKKDIPIYAGSEKSAPWFGHKTAQLKPSWEPILCFRFPGGDGYVENALMFGSGALNIDETRIGTEAEEVGGASGRYPANLLLDPDTAKMVDEQGDVDGHRRGHQNYQSAAVTVTKAGAQIGNGITHAVRHSHYDNVGGFADAGGVSRFFYCSKASRDEREAGLDGFESVEVEVSSGSICEGWKAGTKVKNNHPTVKPIDLNEYFAKMMLPAPVEGITRRILVPFGGIGSETAGCILAGWDEVVAVEMNNEYVRKGVARCEYWSNVKGTAIIPEGRSTEIEKPKQATALFVGEEPIFQ